MDTVGKVEDILKTKGAQVWSIPPEATVFEAINLMAEKNVGALLVMEQGRLVGVVSERDYTRKVILQGRASKQTSVREIISAQVIYVDPQASVQECMRLMVSHRIRHLPVIQQGKVVGVVSIGDLVNWIISSQQSTIHQLHNYIAGQYPG